MLRKWAEEAKPRQAPFRKLHGLLWAGTYQWWERREMKVGEGEVMYHVTLPQFQGRKRMEWNPTQYHSY